MTQPAAHQIFDTALLRQRLARAHTQGAETFLLARVVEDMADRLDAVLRTFSHILDVATPSPHLAARLAAKTGTQVTRLAPLAALEPKAAWTTLPFEAEVVAVPQGSFDLAVSALALHTINDLPGVLAQIRKSLQPDGLFLGSLIGGQTLHELRTAFAEAEEEITGGISPRVSPFADVRDMGGLLQRAGFALPVSDVDTLTLRYDHLFALMRDLRAMGATNALVQRSRKPLSRKVFLRAAEIYATRFSDPDGRVRATFEIIYLSGWVPHESQQKPLAPGSAKMRLADALGAKEMKP